MSASDNVHKEVYRFYSLSSDSVTFQDLPAGLVKRVPKTYPIPVMRTGRLARTNGQPGLGSFLLKDALLRIVAISESTGVFAVIVDAKDDQAVSFYQKFGFRLLENPGNTMVISLKTVKMSLG